MSIFCLFTTWSYCWSYVNSFSLACFIIFSSSVVLYVTWIPARPPFFIVDLSSSIFTWSFCTTIVIITNNINHIGCCFIYYIWSLRLFRFLSFLFEPYNKHIQFYLNVVKACYQPAIQNMSLEVRTVLNLREMIVGSLCAYNMALYIICIQNSFVDRVNTSGNIINVAKE